jgi:hypothetical protein
MGIYYAPHSVINSKHFHIELIVILYKAVNLEHISTGLYNVLILIFAR